MSADIRLVEPEYGNGGFYYPVDLNSPEGFNVAGFDRSCKEIGEFYHGMYLLHYLVVADMVYFFENRFGLKHEDFYTALKNKFKFEDKVQSCGYVAVDLRWEEPVRTISSGGAMELEVGITESKRYLKEAMIPKLGSHFAIGRE